jgi:hypothetical protein
MQKQHCRLATESAQSELCQPARQHRFLSAGAASRTLLRHACRQVAAVTYTYGCAGCAFIQPSVTQEHSERAPSMPPRRKPAMLHAPTS